MQTNRQAELLELHFGWPLSAVARTYGGFVRRLISAAKLPRLLLGQLSPLLSGGCFCVLTVMRYLTSVDCLLVVDIANRHNSRKGPCWENTRGVSYTASSPAHRGCRFLGRRDWGISGWRSPCLRQRVNRLLGKTLHRQGQTARSSENASACGHRQPLVSSYRALAISAPGGIVADSSHRYPDTAVL